MADRIAEDSATENTAAQPPTLDEQQAYYDQRWVVESPAINRLELQRLQRILGAIATWGRNPATDSLVICDLGCGRGWLSNALSCLGDVVGVDLSADAVSMAAKRWPTLHFEQGDVTTWRSSTVFDVVVSSEVLEHVPDKVAFFDTVAALLRPGGLLVLTTPNAAMFESYRTSGAEIQPIEQWVSREELHSLLAERFDVEQLTSFTVDHSNAGVLRWASSSKLRAACTALGLEGARQRVHERLDWGLHFLLAATRRGQEQASA